MAINPITIITHPGYNTVVLKQLLQTTLSFQEVNSIKTNILELSQPCYKDYNKGLERHFV